MGSPVTQDPGESLALLVKWERLGPLVLWDLMAQREVGVLLEREVRMEALDKRV